LPDPDVAGNETYHAAGEEAGDNVKSPLLGNKPGCVGVLNPVIDIMVSKPFSQGMIFVVNTCLNL
jgi:hypothetical protein